jgi:hypothetical protein
MANRSIVNVLGCLTIIAVISGCSSMPTPITISAKPIDKPKLVLPQSDQLFQREIEWVVITPDNVEEQFQKIKDSGRSMAIFGVTDEGYQKLALNLSDLRAYLQQQQAILAAYEGYYQESEEALDSANDEIEGANDEVEAQQNVPEKSIWEKITNQ